MITTEEALPETFALPRECPTAPTSPAPGIRVELVLEGYRVTGEVRLPAGPRRLVDVLNLIDTPYVIAHDGELKDPHHPDDEPLRFPVIHVQRSAILLAVPRSAASGQPSPFEAVAKKAFPARIVLPGLTVSGNIYLAPEADPAKAPLLASSHFIPVTEATVTVTRDGGEGWQEPVVVVNLARVQIYAPKGPAQQA